MMSVKLFIFLQAGESFFGIQRKYYKMNKNVIENCQTIETSTSSEVQTWRILGIIVIVCHLCNKPVGYNQRRQIQLGRTDEGLGTI